MMAGCSSGSTPSSGSSLSPSVVSGVAASGAPLSGKVYLRDSSAHEKSTDIAPATGAFAIDVSDMKAPFMLQATGSAGEKLYSFASGAGTANINPLSSLIVASAATVADPTSIYAAPDSATFQKISSNLAATTAAIQQRLSKLLTIFGAATVNPIADHYEANHQGLDGMFDNVKISTASSSIEITNKNDDTKVVFSGDLSDSNHDSEDDTKLPQPSGLPAAPSHVAALGGSNQVTVSWDGVSGATSYNIYWSTTSGVTKTNGTKISSVKSPYVQTGLTAGTTYYYIVTAVNSNGEGPASTQVSATTLTTAPAVPAAPTGVAAVGGTNQVTVTWTAVSNATSYNIYWSTTTGVTIAKGTKIANATSPAVQTGLAAGTTYYYIVTAVNSAGESLPSVQVSATTLPAMPTVPAAPTGVAATGGTNQVTISWAAVSNATSYNIYWSTTTGVTTATGTKITGVSSPYVQTGLTASTTYYYIVTAVNSAGESPPSSQVSATTAASGPGPNVPAAPTGVTATGSTNEVTVSWAAVTGATSYNLYWSLTTGVTTATGTKIAGVTSPFSHMGLAANTTYYYIVTALNSAGESLPSSQVSAITSVLDGVALYASNCASCHGPLATSTKLGRTAAQIQSAITNNVGGMGFLSSLTPAQVQAIADVLNP